MDQHIHEIALRICEAHDSAHSLSTAILLRNNEWDQIATRSVNPGHYNTPETYRDAAAPTDLLRKLEQLPTSIDRRASAIDTWYRAEKDCFRTNRDIWLCMENGCFPRFYDFLMEVRKNIANVLGKYPEDRLIDLRFGPGATYEHRGSRSTIPDKISYPPTMTEGAWVFSRDFLSSAWCRALQNSLFENHTNSVECLYVKGNRFATVPKDGKTDRAIAIEPALNVSIQLGIGRLMRSRLQKVGLLLDFSQELHRTLAQRASTHGDLATIDLSSASDTVAYELVRAVMPDDWFTVLNAARSPMTEISKGKFIALEKFSSMGNGYTFELETVIFYGILLTLRPTTLSVYGDDIIIDQTLAPAAIELLRACGFRVNESKTFIEGPFRESCGGDFFDGVDVRSLFLKDAKPFWDVPQAFSLHNQLVRHGYDSAAAYVRSQIPSRYRNFGGPTDLGDIVLHGVEGITKVRDCITYYRCLKLLPFQVPLERWDEQTAVASILYGVSSQGVSSRNAPVSYRAGWVARS